MVNYGINIVGILGILLLLLGLLLVPLGLSLRKPFRRGNLFQDIVLALVFLLCGSIFLFQGWRFDSMRAVRPTFTNCYDYLLAD